VETNSSICVGAAIHAAVHQSNSNLKPEWLRVPEAVRLFGISRSALYELIAEGKIKSTCLRKRGAIRGIRIISYDSLASFVEHTASHGGIME
jgi:hypothetical protein